MIFFYRRPDFAMIVVTFVRIRSKRCLRFNDGRSI